MCNVFNSCCQSEWKPVNMYKVFFVLHLQIINSSAIPEECRPGGAEQLVVLKV